MPFGSLKHGHQIEKCEISEEPTQNARRDKTIEGDLCELVEEEGA